MSKISICALLIIVNISLNTLTVSAQSNQKDSIIVTLQPEYNKVNSLYRFLFGNSNRILWATPFKVRILDLQKEKGGLTILQKGGGMQTKSLRLSDNEGEEWVLRSLQKYPDKKLAENLKQTIVKDILQDQVSAINPFGALTVPILAESLGIPHNQPELVFVADDPGLKEYKSEFANATYLFERYTPVSEKNSNSTLKLQEKLQEDNDLIVDQKTVLKARLLDMVIGDWDRHEGQWRWERSKNKGESVYTPIPRDRDQVYYKTSGLFPWIVSHQWLKSRFQPFNGKLRDVKGWNFGAKDFDRYFLNSLDKEDWEAQIAFLQHKLTNNLIRNAVKAFPDQIYRLRGEEIINKLIIRRNLLSEYALEYYEFIAKYVEVPMSDKTEDFNIQIDRNGDVNLIIKNIKKNKELGRILFQRSFKHQTTKEIRLYGFGAEDQFSFSGEPKSKIKIRLIGGDGIDNFEIKSNSGTKKKLYIYDRSDENNKLPNSTLARLRLSKDTSVNQNQSQGFLYDKKGPLFRLNYNVDQGIQIGGGFMQEKQGFRKSPYASKQQLWADYSTGRNSFIFNYTGDFKRVLGENDLKVDVNLLGPNNLSNFFGIGNETLFSNKGNQEISFYRNRYDYLTTKVEMKKALGQRWNIGLNVSGAFYTSSEKGNDNRFLNTFNVLQPEEKVFRNKIHVGLGTSLTLDTRNNSSLPTKGIYWTSEIFAQQQINDMHRSYGTARTEFSFFLKPFFKDFTVGNKIGAGTTLGSPYFYQLMQLGGVSNLRGFNTRRFTGKSSVYHNLDLRVKILDFTSYIIPGSMGLTAFNDFGRVFQPGESSNSWHHGYGGGLYVIPAELIFLQLTYGFSKQGTLPYFSIIFNL